MFRSISYTWRLMGASWDVLRRDKELLVFPALSGLCCLLVLASFAIPIWASGSWEPPGEAASTTEQVIYYGVLFLFYFCNYFVITFFNTAIIAGAVHRLSGGDPTIGSCFREAASRIHLIASWALLAATVGLVIRIIEERSERVGQIIAGLLGMAWSVLTFLVVPVMVVEHKGPIEAFKTSSAMLRKTWGNQLVGNFSFGLIFFLLGLPAFVPIGLGIYAAAAIGSPALAFAGIALGVIYVIMLSLVQSALQSVFQAAIYMYAQGNLDKSMYPDELLSGAMHPRG